MANPKEIRDNIINLLTLADPKNGSGVSIRKWFKGQPPPSRYPGFPWGWVEWAGGPMEAPVGSKAEIKDKFYVVVMDKHIDAEYAENSIMEFANSVEAALDDSPTLYGSVARSFVINREKEKQFQRDYSMIAIRLTLTTFRRE